MGTNQAAYIKTSGPFPYSSLIKTGTRCTSTSFMRSATASRGPAMPGGMDSLYKKFTKHWLTHPPPYMKTALGLADIPASASPLPVDRNGAAWSLEARRSARPVRYIAILSFGFALACLHKLNGEHSPILSNSCIPAYTSRNAPKTQPCDTVW